MAEVAKSRLLYFLVGLPIIIFGFTVSPTHGISADKSQPTEKVARDKDDAGADQLLVWFRQNFQLHVWYRAYLELARQKLRDPAIGKRFWDGQESKRLRFRYDYAKLRAKDLNIEFPEHAFAESYEKMQGKLKDSSSWAGVMKSFYSKKDRAQINEFEFETNTPKVECALIPKLPKLFAKSQKKLGLQSGSSINTKLLDFVQGWNSKKLSCFVAHLSQKSRKPSEKYDYRPLFLLDAIKVTKHQASEDERLSVAFATELFLADRYPESLSELYQLQERWVGYRQLYRQIQRIYSSAQRGSGQVSLQGI